ncbi:MAG: thioredoxin family protein [Gemmatimonadota bacterium]|nr:thioredoxin family protein [Gemmatimonadota bacterium]
MLSASALLLLAGTWVPCPVDDVSPVLATDDDLRQAYESGQTFPDFLRQADARKELWGRNYGNAEVPTEVVERARAIGGQWYVLAIAVAGCSDSVNTIPYVAKLTELVPALDMRIIDSSAGRAYMEARPTPDGRAATPTLILLNDRFDEVGCWIERPTALQEWALNDGGALPGPEFMAEKMSWYRRDGGHSTVSEIVEIIEAAAAGNHICGT